MKDEGPEVPRRAPGLTRTGLFGVAAATLALSGLLFSLLLPWVSYDPLVGPSPIPGLEDGRLGRSELGPARDSYGYVDSLVTAPTVLYSLILAVGFGLGALDEMPRLPLRAHRLGQTALLLGMAALGFLHTLNGTRWFGLYASTLLDDGPSGFHLHIVPYLNLAIGLIVFCGALMLVRRRRLASAKTPSTSRLHYDDVELPLWGVVTLALALLLLPLLPIATSYVGGPAQAVGEGELAIAPPPELKDASRDLGVCRVLLWGALWLNLGCLAVAFAERASRFETLHSAFVFGYAMNGLLALVGLVFALILTFDTYDPPRVAPSLNFVPAGAFLAMAFLWWIYWGQTLRPFLQVARSRPL